MATSANDGRVSLSRGLVWLLSVGLVLLGYLSHNFIPVRFAETREAAARVEGERASDSEQIRRLQDQVQELVDWGPKKGQRYSRELALEDQKQHAELHGEQYAEIISRLVALERSLSATCRGGG